jgi:hypothetical protein
VEAFIAHRDLSRVTLRDGLVERAHRFDVGAGDGVYWPATSPHFQSGWPLSRMRKSRDDSPGRNGSCCLR